MKKHTVNGVIAAIVLMSLNLANAEFGPVEEMYDRSTKGSEMNLKQATDVMNTVFLFKKPDSKGGVYKTRNSDAQDTGALTFMAIQVIDATNFFYDKYNNKAHKLKAHKLIDILKESAKLYQNSDVNIKTHLQIAASIIHNTMFPDRKDYEHDVKMKWIEGDKLKLDTLLLQLIGTSNHEKVVDQYFHGNIVELVDFKKNMKKVKENEFMKINNPNESKPSGKGATYELAVPDINFSRRYVGSYYKEKWSQALAEKRSEETKHNSDKGLVRLKFSAANQKNLAYLLSNKDELLPKSDDLGDAIVSIDKKMIDLIENIPSDIYSLDINGQMNIEQAKTTLEKVGRLGDNLLDLQLKFDANPPERVNIANKKLKKLNLEFSKKIHKDFKIILPDDFGSKSMSRILLGTEESIDANTLESIYKSLFSVVKNNMPIMLVYKGNKLSDKVDGDIQLYYDDAINYGYNKLLYNSALSITKKK